MHAKNNRLNHDFQIVHFLVGSCHTADGAYALLCDLLEDREVALAGVKAAELRARAVMARVEEAKAGGKESEILDAEAALWELRAQETITKRNIAAAEAEVATLRRCIALLQPLRKYAHLPDAQAHEAAQCDEWCGELLHRAENFLLTMGTIPADHFATMRQHPQFAEVLLPAVEEMNRLLQSPQGRDKLMKRIAGSKPAFMALPEVARLALPPPAKE